MAFHTVKVVAQQTNKTDFNLGTKQELFYAQISGSFVEKQGLTTFSPIINKSIQKVMMAVEPKILNNVIKN